MGDRGFALLQSALPKHLLSRCIHWLMRRQTPWLKNLLIRHFQRGYRIALDEAVVSDPRAYPSFNAFFTRALRPAARPLATTPGAITSPVDGTVSQCGRIEGDVLLQAKSHHYSTRELLGGDAELAARFAGGRFACLYLAPYNYHRIHLPLAGTLTRTRHVPGALFSVNAATVRAVPRVFARNERVIAEFDTAAGPLALVMVGALFVGSIETVWAGEINPPPRRRRGVTTLTAGVGRSFATGEEIGRFNMGSTVILLFPRGGIEWDSHLQPGARVTMGQQIGRLHAATAT